jgi:hypothetical protein
LSAPKNRVTTRVESYFLLHPVGPEESALVQSALVQSIPDIRWRLNRIPGFELAILATGSLMVSESNPSLAAPDAEMALELYVRRHYEKELRNLISISRKTASRAANAEAPNSRAAIRSEKQGRRSTRRSRPQAALLAQHRKLPLTQIPGVGFDFSKSRFVTYMSRLTPAQKAELLQTAIAGSPEAPQTMGTAA